jgi:hypothetical protein
MPSPNHKEGITMATATKKTDAPKASGKDRNAAYAAAEKRLREEFPEMFQDFLRDECEKRGLAYKPRLTEEQKAAKMVAEAIAKFGLTVVPEEVLTGDADEEVLIDFPDQPDGGVPDEG